MKSDTCADAQTATAESSVADSNRVQRTTAGRLLLLAIKQLGQARIAASLSTTVDGVMQLTRSSSAMSLTQQRLLAMAVLAIGAHGDLRRQAAALLGQVKAAEAYHAGATERHQEAPGRWNGWR